MLLSSLTQELKWILSPQTPISWLNVYMQVAYLKETDELLIPRYPQATFTQIAEVCASLPKLIYPLGILIQNTDVNYCVTLILR